MPTVLNRQQQDAFYAKHNIRRMFVANKPTILDKSVKITETLVNLSNLANHPDQGNSSSYSFGQPMFETPSETLEFLADASQERIENLKSKRASKLMSLINKLASTINKAIDNEVDFNQSVIDAIENMQFTVEKLPDEMTFPSEYSNNTFYTLWDGLFGKGHLSLKEHAVEIMEVEVQDDKVSLCIICDGYSFSLKPSCNLEEHNSIRSGANNVKLFTSKSDAIKYVAIIKENFTNHQYDTENK